MISLRTHHHRKPVVYVAESEFERLSELADSSVAHGAILLGDELVRAVVLKDDEFPPAFVRLHSVVEYTDLTSARSRRVQIVPPDEADIDRNRLSVLSPVGAALIGLVVGETIGLATKDGRQHVLQVDAVEPAHEAA